MNLNLSRLIILISAVSGVFLAGCASIFELSFKDNTYFNDFAADEYNKGYVEFYVGDSSELRIAVLSKCIEKSFDNKILWDEIIIGLLGEYNRDTKVRIAEKPGSYTYIVKKGGSVSTVRVSVTEGMLTPVRVDMKNLFVEEIAGRIVKFFEINVIPGQPIPFTPRPAEHLAKKAGN